MKIHSTTCILLLTSRAAVAFDFMAKQSYNDYDYDHDNDSEYEYDDACVHCPDYLLSSADNKQEVIMGKVRGTEYDYNNLPPFPTLCTSIERLKGVDFNNIFDRFSDERPAVFDRFFHFSGIVGSIKFEKIGNHDFTGIFQGADHGVLRWSPLAPLLAEKYLVNHFIGTFLFSAAIKFFRDGIHSGNIMTGDSAKGLDEHSEGRQFYDLPNFNIFSRNVDNMSGLGDNLDPLFGEFEKISGAISTVDAATFDQFGQETATIKAPVFVSFRPNPTYKEKFGLGPTFDFREWATNVDAIAPGETLYSVYTTVLKSNGDPSLCVDVNGIPQADDDVATWCPEQKVLHLGNIIMTSRFYAAEWPDEWLFFQHHRMCPRDRATCAFDNDATTPLPTEPNGEGLGTPDTTYPVLQSEFCLSTNDTSGALLGAPPACPLGSDFKKSTCYEEDTTASKVISNQQTTCPMMDKLADEIKGIAPGADTSLPNCDTGEFILNTFLTGFLTVTSPILRGITTACPFCKDPIDFILAVLQPAR